MSKLSELCDEIEKCPTCDGGVSHNIKKLAKAAKVLHSFVDAFAEFDEPTARTCLTEVEEILNE